jgi:hypothetical protein
VLPQMLQMYEDARKMPTGEHPHARPRPAAPAGLPKPQAGRSSPFRG